MLGGARGARQRLRRRFFCKAIVFVNFIATQSSSVRARKSSKTTTTTRARDRLIISKALDDVGAAGRGWARTRRLAAAGEHHHGNARAMVSLAFEGGQVREGRSREVCVCEAGTRESVASPWVKRTAVERRLVVGRDGLAVSGAAGAFIGGTPYTTPVFRLRRERSALSMSATGAS